VILACHHDRLTAAVPLAKGDMAEAAALMISRGADAADPVVAGAMSGAQPYTWTRPARPVAFTSAPPVLRPTEPLTGGTIPLPAPAGCQAALLAFSASKGTASASSLSAAARPWSRPNCRPPTMSGADRATT
jgi:hypothetical protein